MRQKQNSGGYVEVILVIAAILIILILAFVFLNRQHSAAKTSSSTKDLSSYCVGKTLTTGGSGNCVSDIQNLVNYMENSGLTECPFEGAATLTVNGTFDDTTATQVKAVQGWAACYAKQEGFSTNVQQTGTVDKTTWGELCTYSYTNPSHNGATSATAAIAAGKDAGCPQLQS